METTLDKSGNPIFAGDVSAKSGRVSGKAAAMTARGTYIKTMLLLVVVIAAAYTAWQGTAGWLAAGASWWTFWLTMVGSFFIAMMISFKPATARILAVPYAALQGLLLGVTSALYNQVSDGIVGMAVFLTIVIFFGVLLGYQTGLLKASSKFRRIVMTALLSIAAYYLLSWILALFGITAPLIVSTSTWGIAFSVLVVITAALSLVLDFDFIEQASHQKLPKYMEWYSAFGLMVGLLWLYVELLRLLAKLAVIRNR